MKKLREILELFLEKLAEEILKNFLVQSRENNWRHTYNRWEIFGDNTGSKFWPILGNFGGIPERTSGGIRKETREGIFEFFGAWKNPRKTPRNLLRNFEKKKTPWKTIEVTFEELPEGTAGGILEKGYAMELLDESKIKLPKLLEQF